MTTITGGIQTRCGVSKRYHNRHTGKCKRSIWDFDLLLGIDTIKALVGVCMTRYEDAKFEGRMSICDALCVTQIPTSNRESMLQLGNSQRFVHLRNLENRVLEFPVSSQVREE